MLLYELHTSNHAYLKRKFTLEEDKTNLANILQESQRALSEASQILRDDFTVQGGQLREVVAKANQMWEMWKIENKEVIEVFKHL